MSPNKQSDSGDYLSAEELHQWLQQELKDLAKAHELRIKEATSFVSAYMKGELSPKEADDRYQKYQDRWGEALPGAYAKDGISDEQILAAIDQVQLGKFRDSALMRINRNETPDKKR